ncbi:hypothetical protein CK203_001232 [Vitis vinifera]|uniref:DUF7081 domain-containing protein n=1 Tax=Vitis vinifera TaxID=29760 RepID=A0A438KM06_VITVI|nr:hypothetical protein CK203_001232 [Vitis vinifera]
MIRIYGWKKGDEGGKNKEGERKASKRQHLDEGLASSISTQTTKGPMEVEPHESNGSTAGIKDNGLHLYPVPLQASGQGLPYAPIDWPCPGDVCGWKVGRRVTGSGYHLDRYLYLPSRFSKKSFSSRLPLNNTSERNSLIQILITFLGLSAGEFSLKRHLLQKKLNLSDMLDGCDHAKELHIGNRVIAGDCWVVLAIRQDEATGDHLLKNQEGCCQRCRS